MKSFNGTWKDQVGSEITIEETDNFLTVTYENPKRGPFTGLEIDLSSPVIDVNFTDDHPFVGVLGKNNGKSQILWNNHTIWTKN